MISRSYRHHKMVVRFQGRTSTMSKEPKALRMKLSDRINQVVESAFFAGWILAQERFGPANAPIDGTEIRGAFERYLENREHFDTQHKLLEGIAQADRGELVDGPAAFDAIRKEIGGGS